jgi:hypothetical protein
MAVRVRVRISLGDRSLETIALVNTGYEAETPQILSPYTRGRGSRSVATTRSPSSPPMRPQEAL